jgi:hypothetical protein
MSIKNPVQIFRLPEIKRPAVICLLSDQPLYMVIKIWCFASFGIGKSIIH